ncbi:MAG: rhomboid family intramembrane serine protease [Planctomycetes bacterium]|nr:rhomboid family intramembrane serine protease [Planctomycetota bacterium]
MSYDSYQGGGHFRSALPGLTPGVKILLIVNLVGFVVNNLLLRGGAVPVVGLSWDGLWSGYGLGLLRLISYQFVHDLAIGHILGNMLFLYFFGTMIEGGRGEGFASSYLWLGRTGIIKLYLTAGVIGGLIHMLFSQALLIGASGAVYGIMVFAAFVYPRRVLHFIFISVEVRYFVGLLVFIGLYSFYIETFVAGLGSNVAHSAHLGGSLWGFLAFRMARAGVSFSGRGPLAWWRRRRAEGAHKSAQRDQETLDQILDKVHKQGMSSLTGAERRFLEKVSRSARK